jgi:hypothetical protein
MLDDVAPELKPRRTGTWETIRATLGVASLRGLPMARISVSPVWVRVLDFVTRFPTALSG